MKNKLSIIIFTLFLMLSFGSVEQVLACTCGGEQPICEAFADADEVFIGKVVGAKTELPETNKNGEKVIYGYQEIYFQINESIYGTSNKSTVTLFSENTTCDYSFEIGKSYLVYAYGKSDELGTSACSRTRPISEVVKGELEELRKSAKNVTGTHVSGSYTLSGQLDLEPIVATKIKLQSTLDESSIFETLTDNYGKYIFENIPAGSYNFLLTKPENTEFGDKYFDIKLKGKGCEVKNFSIYNNSSFAGKIVNQEGNPVEDVSVEFIPTSSDFSGDYAGLSYWEDSTDKDGSFNFEGLGIGNYFLAVNFKQPPNEDTHFPTVIYPNTTSPSEATVFSIKRGQKLDGIIFTIPKPLKEIVISGKIKRTSGKSPVDMQIRLRDIEKDQLCCFALADDDGTFEIKGYEGRKYIFEIADIFYESEIVQKVSEEFVLKEKPKYFNLTLIENTNKKVSNRK